MARGVLSFFKLIAECLNREVINCLSQEGEEVRVDGEDQQKEATSALPTVNGEVQEGPTITSEHDQDVFFSTLTVAQLRRICTKRGLSYQKKNKKQLLEVLTA